MTFFKQELSLYLTVSLEKLINNLSDHDFKYLTEEFGSKNLELLKQKRCLPL